MTHLLKRLGISFLVSTMLLPALVPFAHASAEDRITFSKPVIVGPHTTFDEILQQSDNFEDGTLEVGDHMFVLNEYGHFELDRKEGWLCSWFGWFCPPEPEVDTEAMNLNQNQAKAIVVNTVVPEIQAEMQAQAGRTLPLLAYSWPEPLPAGAVVKRLFEYNPPLNIIHDSWFFFLDLEPDARWGHRAEYVLVNAQTGNVTRQRVFSPPILGGDDQYVAGAFEHPHRFYPASEEDMPESGEWPLQFEAPSTNQPGSSEPQAWAPSTNYADAQTRWSIIPFASAQGDGDEPCEEPRKKVGFVIAGQGFSDTSPPGYADGSNDQADSARYSQMLINLGVKPADMHMYNPDKEPDLDKVVAKLRAEGSKLGPCDKLFIVLIGHGGIIDRDKDGIPDRPSDDFDYGKPGKKKRLWKTETKAKHSLPGILREFKAGDINIVIEACYSGSFDEVTYSGPANGSTWHLFLSSHKTKTSKTGGKGRPSRYSRALTECMQEKAREFKIQNGRDPNIEEIETMMKECHDAIDIPQNPPTSVHLNEETKFTISTTELEIKEGDEGVTEATVTITRDTATRFQQIYYRVEANRYHSATSNVDFQPEDSRALFPVGASTATITIRVNGDTKIEEDESFWLKFTSAPRFTNYQFNFVPVYIIDDDKPKEETETGASTSVDDGKDVEGVYLDPIIILPKDGVTGNLDQYLDGATIDGSGSTDTTPPTAECTKCDPILQEITNKKNEIDRLDAERKKKEREVQQLKQDVNDAQRELNKAQKALDDFNNPKSWASSDGRFIDSSDLEAIKRSNRALWDEYKSGNMTAQELSDAWGQQLTRDQLDQLKNQIRQELQNAVNNAQAALQAAQNALNIAQQQLNDIKQKMADCALKILALWNQYWACILTCNKEDDVTIIKLDFTTDDEDEAMEDLGNSPGLKEYFEFHFDEEIYVPAGEVVEVEIKVDITEDDTGLVVDNFKFEVDDEDIEVEVIKFVIVCPECDAIKQEIEKKKQECRDIRKEYDAKIGEIDANADELRRLHRQLDAKKKELDRFNNPDDWAESEGRRVDTTDLRLMRELNSQLLEAYSNGDITAQELEDGWNKLPEDTAELRKKLREKMEKEIAEIEKKIKEHEDIQKKLGKEAGEIATKLEACNKQLAALEAKLKECEATQCKEPKDEDQVGWLDDLELVEEEDDDGGEGGGETGRKDCPDGTSRHKECLDTCDGNCVYDSCTGSTEGLCGYAAQALACYRCEKTEVEPIDTTGTTTGTTGGGGSESSESSSSSSSSSAEPEPSCPAGTYEDAGCNNRCSASQECTVVDEMGSKVCYGCTDKPKEDPPPRRTGTSVTSPPTNDDPVVEESCSDKCARNGFSESKPDFTSYIAAQIEGEVCVSGYSAAFGRVNVSGCTCYTNDPPQITFNRAKPTCPAAPCEGTLLCGESTSCGVPGGTATVSCNWNGWQQTGVNQFRPQLGN